MDFTGVVYEIFGVITYFNRLCEHTIGFIKLILLVSYRTTFL